jgi:hypothetical protein
VIFAAGRDSPEGGKHPSTEGQNEKKETVCIGFRGLTRKYQALRTTRTWAQGIWNTPAGRQASSEIGHRPERI